MVICTSSYLELGGIVTHIRYQINKGILMIYYNYDTLSISLTNTRRKNEKHRGIRINI